MENQPTQNRPTRKRTLQPRPKPRLRLHPSPGSCSTPRPPASGTSRVAPSPDRHKESASIESPPSEITGSTGATTTPTPRSTNTDGVGGRPRPQLSQQEILARASCRLSQGRPARRFWPLIAARPPPHSANKSRARPAICKQTENCPS